MFKASVNYTEKPWFKRANLGHRSADTTQGHLGAGTAIRQFLGDGRQQVC